MTWLLIFAILIMRTLPLYAQGQAPNAAEIAQKVVSIISGDRANTQTYCQVANLSDELDQVDRHQDRKKAEDLSQKIDELQKKLGPEYLALLEATKDVDPDSKDVRRLCRSLISSTVPASDLLGPARRGRQSPHYHTAAQDVRFWHKADMSFALAVALFLIGIMAAALIVHYVVR